MSALGKKVLDLAEQQGLLDGKAIAELRRQVAESKFVVTPEAIAKVLVDHGHLTPFQARKLVSHALGNVPDPVEERVVEKAQAREKPKPLEDLTFADESRPARPKPRENPSPTLDRPVEGSTADDFVELEEIDTARPTRGNRWKTDQPLNETIELTPIDLSAPPPPAAPAPAPIDDLFGPESIPTPKAAPAAKRTPAVSPTPLPDLLADDLFGPGPLATSPLGTSPLEATPLTKPLPQPMRLGKNVWDSPLLLIGGGALGVVIVAFALLFYALTRGSAAEMFGKAEEEYRGGSYGSASARYEKFLKQYPDDPNASLARVRRGMAMLRQVTDDSKNPRLGLDTARQVLPQIETEDKFSEARSELSTILPEIADGFATQATQATDTAKKEELVKLAGDALDLVNNPSYVPASLRKERESHIVRIVDKLKVAERSIQQDKDLVSAVDRIAAATDKGNAAAAYQVQADLLRTYPSLATSPQLVAAIRGVGEKERQLVKISQGGPAPFTTDPAAGSDRVVLSFRDGAPAGDSANVQPVFVLVEGSVYGLDAANGRVLWRRFVGYETATPPVAIATGGRADAVLIDGRRRELVRVNGTTGELAWRQPLGDEAAGPVVAGNRVLATTRKGRLVAIDAATGEIYSAAQLPQGASVAPVIRHSRLFQLGEHSTLFVLDADSLACTETVYLAHKAGAIFVPPVAVLDQVLVIESPADDYSQVQVLSPDPKTKRLTPFGRPQRLKGRVVTPLSVSGARVAIITDLGQTIVSEVDPAAPQERLRLIASLDASESTPRLAFCEFKENRLFLASHRRSLYEVQAAQQLLARRWTENRDDEFLQPLQLQGDMLVQVRRRSGSAAVLVEGSRATSGETVWTTHLAAPIAALVPSEARQTVDALTEEGRVFPLAASQFAAVRVEQRGDLPASATAAIFPDTSLSLDGQSLVWTDSQSGRAHLYDLKSGAAPVAISLPAKAIAPAAILAGGVLAPLGDGSVALVARPPMELKVTPFMPPLSPDALPQWTKPAPLADDKTFLISDGRNIVYAVTYKDKPQPQLVIVNQSQLAWPVVFPFAVAGRTALGVVRLEGSDAVAGFDARAAAAFEPVALKGRVEAGPFAVGGVALVAAEPDGLVCIGADGKVRWQQPLEQGPLAGPVVACPDGDLLAIFQSGAVCRLDAATGKELARHEVGEPLLGPACILGQNVFASGSDGVVHRLKIPPRP